MPMWLRWVMFILVVLALTGFSIWFYANVWRPGYELIAGGIVFVAVIVIVCVVKWLKR
jgi:hypothetical protein